MNLNWGHYSILADQYIIVYYYCLMEIAPSHQSSKLQKEGREALLSESLTRIFQGNGEKAVVLHRPSLLLLLRPLDRSQPSWLFTS